MRNYKVIAFVDVDAHTSTGAERAVFTAINHFAGLRCVIVREVPAEGLRVRCRGKKGSDMQDLVMRVIDLLEDFFGRERAEERARNYLQVAQAEPLQTLVVELAPMVREDLQQYTDGNEDQRYVSAILIALSIFHEVAIEREISRA